MEAAIKEPTALVPFGQPCTYVLQVQTLDNLGKLKYFKQDLGPKKRSYLSARLQTQFFVK